MTHRWKLVVLFLMTFINYCFNQTYIVAPSSVEATYQKSKRIDVKIDFNNPGDSIPREVKDLYIEYNNGAGEIKIAHGTKTSFTEIAKDTHFEGRISTLPFNESSMMYSFILDGIRYDDDMVLTHYLLYKNAGNAALETSQTKINVTGGPTKCGKRLAPKYTFDIDSPNPIPIELCGNTRPTLLITFGSHPEYVVQNFTAVSGKYHQYLYNIQLSNLKTSDCNSILKYRATGEGPDLEGETTRIDLKFTPTVTNITSARNGRTLSTTWDKILTGSCSDVTYELHYYHSNGNLTNITVSSTAKNHHQYVADNLEHVKDVTKVSIQATYANTYKSQVYNHNVTDITPVTTTTTTTTLGPPRNETIIGDDSDGLDIVLIISLAVGLGVLVIIIVFILIFCVCRKKSKSFTFDKDKVNHQNHSIHEYPHKTSNPMYAVDTGHEAVDAGSVNVERQPYIEKSPAHSDSTSNIKIADAQLKFYDPQEFDISSENGYTFAQGDKQSPPGSPATPPPFGGEVDNYSYQNDEYATVTRKNRPELV